MPLSWLPNTISLLRIALLIPYIWLFLAHAERQYLFILAIIIIASDKLDGTLARKLKVESKLGEFLDSLADSLFVLTSWLLFYFQGFYEFAFLIMLLLPRLLMGVSMLLYRMQKQKWNLCHTRENKIVAVVNFAAILWLLAGLSYIQEILWMILGINYFGLVLYIIERYEPKHL